MPYFSPISLLLCNDNWTQIQIFGYHAHLLWISRGLMASEIFFVKFEKVLYWIWNFEMLKFDLQPFRMQMGDLCPLCTTNERHKASAKTRTEVSLK